MNQKQIQINSIHIGASGGGYYVSFSDTDSSVDYFNGYSMSLKSVIETIREYSSDWIMVYGNGDDEHDELYQKRLQKLAKINRYKIIEKDNRTFLVL